MKLIKVVPKTQAMYYRLADNQRKINNTKNLILYQINPKKKITSPNGNYTYVRILFEDIWKMQQYLEEYEKKNCTIHAA